MGGVRQPDAKIVKMSDEDYFADKRIGRSDIFAYHKSPAFYKAKLDGEIEPASSPAMFFGSAFHAMVLEPEEFSSRYRISESTSKTSKAYKSEQELAKSEGAQLIAAHDYATMVKMRKSCMEHDFFKSRLEDSDSLKENVILFDLMGVPAKAKVDLLAGSAIVDLKTSASADPEDFRGSLLKYGYHWQSFWYKQAAAAVGIDCEFYFAVISKSAPHEFSIIKLSSDYDELAEEEVSSAIEGISMGKYESKWKDAVFTLSPRGWETRRREYDADVDPGKESTCQWCEDRYLRKNMDDDCSSCGMMLCGSECLDIHECK